MMKRSLLSWAAAAALLLPGAVLAQSYGAFMPSGDFVLEIAGVEIPEAEFFRSTSVPSVLVMTPALPAPVLVVPGARRVETINVMKLSKQGDGILSLLPGATLAPQGGFEIDGQSIRFTVDGKAVTLSPKPDLLGNHEAAGLKQYSHLYVKGAKDYRPDAATISRLKQQGQPVKVKVFFGSWCPHCQRTVPGAVRVAEELAGSKIDFDFYGVKRGFGDDPEAKKADIDAVPTAVVYVNGREAGRIEENDWNAPERALSRILSGGASGR